MKTYAYNPVRFTPGIWKHKTLPVTFTFAVDNFDVKYFHIDHADYLFSALQQHYNIKIDCKSRYTNISLESCTTKCV